MAQQRQYWRVSPNVMNDEQTVDSWKEAIRDTSRAIMGDRKGKEVWDWRFAEKVQKGDIILIARRCGNKSDMFAFGKVDGPCKNDYFDQSGMNAYYLDLKPFKLWEEDPPGIQLHGLWPRGHALQQLYPKRKDVHKRLCEWMEKQLERLENSNDDRRHGKPRQPDIELRHKVEEAAYKAVEKCYKENHYHVDDVQKDKCGYDLKATKNGRTLKVEVKGLRGANASTELTPNEYQCIRDKDKSYRLCIVTNALRRKPKKHIQEFKFDSKKRRWFDQDGKELTIEEIMGARVKG